MLQRTLRLARAFGFPKDIHAKNPTVPGFFSSKKQVDLDKYIRDYRDTPERLHPSSQRAYNKRTKELEPLKYKLHAMPENPDFDTPLGVTQQIPWTITRTKSENLPVYRRYTRRRTQNFTEIRLVEGDIEVD